jgi:hypothetical protein
MSQFTLNNSCKKMLSKSRLSTEAFSKIDSESKRVNGIISSEAQFFSKVPKKYMQSPY